MTNPSKSSPESPAKEQPGEVAAMLKRLRDADGELARDECWSLHYDMPEGKLWGDAAALIEKLGQGWIPVLLDAREYILTKAGRHDLNWRDGHAIIERIDSLLPPPPERP